MKYTAYALMFAMVLSFSSFVFAQNEWGDLDSLMKQLQAQGGTGAVGSTGTVAPVTDPTHNAAEIKIQNTTYTHNGSEYVLTWTPVQGTSKVEVSVKNADTDMDYTKVSTVAGSAGTVKVNLTSQGTYMIKFTPVDDLSTPLWPDQIMTIKVEAAAKAAVPVKTNPATTVKAAPQVGPAQDLLFGGLILVAILYFVYRFRSNEA